MPRTKALEARNLWKLGWAALAVQLAGCVMPQEPAVFDPRLMQRSERAQSRLDHPEELYPLATTQPDLMSAADADAIISRPTTGPSLGSEEEPILRMSLQQAIQRSVLYNHAVKVAGYQPAIDASRVTEAEALFDPTLFTNLQFQRKDDTTAGEIFTNPSGGGIVTSTTFTDKQDVYEGQAGIKQNLVSGGQVQFSFDSTYNELIPQRFVNNPFYQNKLSLQLTQPLLRDFGADVNEARIYINRDDARVSLLEFRKTLEEQISKVEEAYWQLIEAQGNVVAEESLLKENESSYELQMSRFRQHLISTLEVSQVLTSLEARRGSLIRAKADAKNLSDQLKQLINDPNLPVASPVLIDASDEPVTVPMKLDIEDEISSAVENRFELGEQLLKIDTANVTYKVAQNNTLPKLNFVGSATPNITEGNYEQTISNETKFAHFEWSLGLQLEFPIGNREALAILHRTELQRLQAIEQYSTLISQVSLDVKQGSREVETAYKLIEANRQSRMAAETALQDEVQRQEEGTVALTPENVQLRLTLADELVQHQEAENQAVANYNIALERLERAKGTLLKYNNVILQEQTYKNEGLLR